MNSWKRSLLVKTGINYTHDVKLFFITWLSDNTLINSIVEVTLAYCELNLEILLTLSSGPSRFSVFHKGQIFGIYKIVASQLCCR